MDDLLEMYNVALAERLSDAAILSSCLFKIFIRTGLPMQSIERSTDFKRGRLTQ